MYALGFGKRDRLNEELGGGFPPGSIVLVEGRNGAGKSALSQRFASGLCEEGNRVTYLSTELSMGSFLQQMNSLDYDMVKHVLDDDILFLHADIGRGGSSFTGDLPDDDGTGNGRRNHVQRLMQAEAMWESDVVIVDTFDTILRNDATLERLAREGRSRQAALEIVSFLRGLTARGTVIVLTVDPTALDPAVLDPFRSIADVLLQLEMVQVGREVQRQINVRRFAGMGAQVGDTIGYAVRPHAGIVIQSRSVV
jgi:flagellar protein FlaH